MERHLVGFCIFLLTFVAGVCSVNYRLLVEEEEEFKCFAYAASQVVNPDSRQFEA